MAVLPPSRAGAILLRITERDIYIPFDRAKEKVISSIRMLLWKVISHFKILLCICLWHECWVLRISWERRPCSVTYSLPMYLHTVCLGQGGASGLFSSSTCNERQTTPPRDNNGKLENKRVFINPETCIHARTHIRPSVQKIAFARGVKDTRSPRICHRTCDGVETNETRHRNGLGLLVSHGCRN